MPGPIGENSDRPGWRGFPGRCGRWTTTPMARAWLDTPASSCQARQHREYAAHPRGGTPPSAIGNAMLLLVIAVPSPRSHAEPTHPGRCSASSARRTSERRGSHGRTGSDRKASGPSAIINGRHTAGPNRPRSSCSPSAISGSAQPETVKVDGRPGPARCGTRAISVA